MMSEIASAARKLWNCARCGHTWLSRVPRPPACPACFERHHDAAAYLKARAERAASAA
jgi:rubrerythrin